MLVEKSRPTTTAIASATSAYQIWRAWAPTSERRRAPSPMSR